MKLQRSVSQIIPISKEVGQKKIKRVGPRDMLTTAALKVPESLCQLQRLNNNALLLFIVSDLGVSGQGEILA
jgi:hypothetical protein